jgi:hypothetical protein
MLRTESLEKKLDSLWTRPIVGRSCIKDEVDFITNTRQRREGSFLGYTFNI